MISCTSPKQKAAFTLVELLIAMGAIAILVSILLPTLSLCQKTALRTKTKAQFGQYALALEQYRLEYGHYPHFLIKSGEQKINLAQHNAEFIKTLSGRTPYPDCGSLSHSDRQQFNPKALCFYTFDEEDFTNNTLTDALGNPNIYIIVDTDNNGLIQNPELPKKNPLRARIFIFTQKKDGTDFEDVCMQL